MILDHINLYVSDYATSREFYVRALKHLGIFIVKEDQHGALFGREAQEPNGEGKFWIGIGEAPHSGVHIAFQARNRDEVDAFYHAALDHGGSDHGKPGLRPEYHKDYHAAFVCDPDGNNIEAVHHLTA